MISPLKVATNILSQRKRFSSPPKQLWCQKYHSYSPQPLSCAPSPGVLINQPSSLSTTASPQISPIKHHAQLLLLHSVLLGLKELCNHFHSGGSNKMPQIHQKPAATTACALKSPHWYLLGPCFNSSSTYDCFQDKLGPIPVVIGNKNRVQSFLRVSQSNLHITHCFESFLRVKASSF